MVRPLGTLTLGRRDITLTQPIQRAFSPAMPGRGKLARRVRSSLSGACARSWAIDLGGKKRKALLWGGEAAQVWGHRGESGARGVGPWLGAACLEGRRGVAWPCRALTLGPQVGSGEAAQEVPVMPHREEN